MFIPVHFGRDQKVPKSSPTKTTQSRLVCNQFIRHGPQPLRSIIKEFEPDHVGRGPTIDISRTSSEPAILAHPNHHKFAVIEFRRPPCRKVNSHRSYIALRQDESINRGLQEPLTALILFFNWIAGMGKKPASIRYHQSIQFADIGYVVLVRRK